MSTVATTASALAVSNADIVQVTSIERGQIYKILHTTSYDTSIKYGIVLDILRNENSVAIVANEISSGYGSITTEQKVYADDKPMNLFHVTEEELKSVVPSLFAAAKNFVIKKQAELADARHVASTLEAVLMQAHPDFDQD